MWFGLVVWIPEIPLWKGLLIPLVESQTTGLQNTNLPLVEISTDKKNMVKHSIGIVNSAVLQKMNVLDIRMEFDAPFFVEILLGNDASAQTNTLCTQRWSAFPLKNPSTSTLERNTPNESYDLGMGSERPSILGTFGTWILRVFHDRLFKHGRMLWNSGPWCDCD